MATVYFEGTQIYEAGIVSVIKNNEGKLIIEKSFNELLDKIHSVIHSYGRSPTEFPKEEIYQKGYYITKDGSQIHIWTKELTQEFKNAYYDII